MERRNNFGTELSHRELPCAAMLDENVEEALRAATGHLGRDRRWDSGSHVAVLFSRTLGLQGFPRSEAPIQLDDNPPERL